MVPLDWLFFKLDCLIAFVKTLLSISYQEVIQENNMGFPRGEPSKPNLREAS